MRVVLSGALVALSGALWADPSSAQNDRSVQGGQRIAFEYPAETEMQRHLRLMEFRLYSGLVPWTNSPELKGFGQNIDYSSGWFAGAGTTFFWPAGHLPLLGTTWVGLGADIEYGEIRARQITNQGSSAVLPVDGTLHQLRAMPGIYLRRQMNPWLLVRASARFGVAWQDLDLSSNNTRIVTARGTAGTFAVDAGVDIKVLQNVLLGLTVGYRTTGDLPGTVVASGESFDFGGLDEIIVGLKADICLPLSPGRSTAGETYLLSGRGCD